MVAIQCHPSVFHLYNPATILHHAQHSTLADATTRASPHDVQTVWRMAQHLITTPSCARVDPLVLRVADMVGWIWIGRRRSNLASLPPRNRRRWRNKRRWRGGGGISEMNLLPWESIPCPPMPIRDSAAVDDHFKDDRCQPKRTEALIPRADQINGRTENWITPHDDKNSSTGLRSLQYVTFLNIEWPSLDTTKNPGHEVAHTPPVLHGEWHSAPSHNNSRGLLAACGRIIRLDNNST